jgi:hypothetical protein
VTVVWPIKFLGFCFMFTKIVYNTGIFSIKFGIRWLVACLVEWPCVGILLLPWNRHHVANLSGSSDLAYSSKSTSFKNVAKLFQKYQGIPCEFTFVIFAWWAMAVTWHLSSSSVNKARFVSAGPISMKLGVRIPLGNSLELFLIFAIWPILWPPGDHLENQTFAI